MGSLRAVVAIGAAALLLGVALSCSQIDESALTRPSDPPNPAAAIAADPVVVAAGDLVCGTGTPAGTACKHAATAALVSPLAPAAVLLLGDIQYETATLADFNTYFGPTWGAHKAITWPAAGDHEYQSGSPSGYFDYFNGVGVQNGRAGDRSKGYYSFDVGAWHLIAINSNCGSIGGCGIGSPQEQWLRADLAANPRACTLAYWHHPRFSSGSHGNNSSMQAIWQALYDNGADLVLAGHDHDYERFGPQTAAGVLDNSRGLRSFVVGTGGKEKGSFGAIRANSELRSNSSFGLLKLSLHAASYDWQFVPIAGDTLADAGTAACQTAQPPPPPPTQTTLTILPSAEAHVPTDPRRRPPNQGDAPCSTSSRQPRRRRARAQSRLDRRAPRNQGNRSFLNQPRPTTLTSKATATTNSKSNHDQDHHKSSGPQGQGNPPCFPASLSISLGPASPKLLHPHRSAQGNHQQTQNHDTLAEIVPARTTR